MLGREFHAICETRGVRQVVPQGTLVGEDGPALQAVEEPQPSSRNSIQDVVIAEFAVCCCAGKELTDVGDAAIRKQKQKKATIVIEKKKSGKTKQLPQQAASVSSHNIHNLTPKGQQLCTTYIRDGSYPIQASKHQHCPT